MAARSRDSVERSASSDSQMTYSRFFELFPDNRACLDYLRDKFYPKGTECPSCGKPSKFHAIKGRSAYGCQYCGHQVYPTAHTIFLKSTTSLQLWFYAIYLMSSTRCGISAKQLGREIGVTYKTAHRMFKMIRTVLRDDSGPLSGDVEVDETAYGGKPRAREMRERTGNVRKTYRPTVLGMVERGGRVRTLLIPDRGGATIKGRMREHILPSSMIFTDEWPLYRGVDREWRGHRRINHKERVYVDGATHTQTIEGFFGLFKSGVRGVYHAISTTYLQDYLNEYAFRYNRRDRREPMFWAILDRVRKDRPALGAS
jgi:transposase